MSYTISAIVAAQARTLHSKGQVGVWDFLQLANQAVRKQFLLDPRVAN